MSGTPVPGAQDQREAAAGCWGALLDGPTPPLGRAWVNLASAAPGQILLGAGHWRRAHPRRAITVWLQPTVQAFEYYARTTEATPPPARPVPATSTPSRHRAVRIERAQRFAPPVLFVASLCWARWWGPWHPRTLSWPVILLRAPGLAFQIARCARTVATRRGRVSAALGSSLALQIAELWALHTEPIDPW